VLRQPLRRILPQTVGNGSLGPEAEENAVTDQSGQAQWILAAGIVARTLISMPAANEPKLNIVPA